MTFEYFLDVPDLFDHPASLHRVAIDSLGNTPLLSMHSFITNSLYSLVKDERSKVASA